MKILCVLPHSHTWFWTQTALCSFLDKPPGLENAEIQWLVVDNSYEWSPTYYGYEAIAEHYGTRHLIFRDNTQVSKFHATALDFAIETFDVDYLMALETDVLALKDGWLAWYFTRMRETDYAVGAWHHEAYVNPSCTLYRGTVLREMAAWCRANESPIMHWGPDFQFVGTLPDGLARSMGPFAEKRGWPPNTLLKTAPSGQLRGEGWYEPGQQLHHWAEEHGYTWTVLPTQTIIDPERQIPTGTFYLPQADAPIDTALTAHLWGGTRALDLLKHPVSDPTVLQNFTFWLAREARYWKAIVPPEVQAETLRLIRKHGWYSRPMTERDVAAVATVQAAYADGGVVI